MTRVTIKEVLDEEFKDVKFDTELCKRIIKYNVRLMNVNANHSAFFGGVLIGVNEIRFHESDMELWYEDVLGIDEEMLKHNFARVSSIDKDHKVISTAFNHLPGYITYRLNQERNIPQNVRHEAEVALFMIMHIRFLTSLLVPRFKYPAKKAIAEAAFAALSYKYDIKNYGSWRDLLKARSEDILVRDSIYAKVFQQYNDEHMAIRLVSDKQTLIRKLINKYFGVYCLVKENGGRIVTTSDMMMSTDGDMVLKDRTTGYSTYVSYLNTVIQRERDFIRPELQTVVEQAVEQMPPQLLDKTLAYMSKNYTQARMKHLETFTEECLLYTFDYLQSIRTQAGRNTDLVGMVTQVRAKLMASRSEDIRVLTIREAGEQIVKEATGVKTPASLAATRTGLMLYLMLRAMTRQHYDS
jgi:hypothetical protein